MKKNYMLFIAMLVMALVISCGSAPANQSPANLQVMPSWFNLMPPPDEVWGVGFIKLQNPGLALQTATVDAQRDASSQLSILVQGVLINHANEAGLQGNERSIRSIDNITRAVANMNLSGATVIAREQTSDGFWWVRVSVKRADAMRQVNSIVNNEMADFADFKADQALRRLDAEINRQR